MEKHVQTILCALVAALVLWVGKSINELQQQGVRVEERLIAIQQDSARLEERVTRLERSPSHDGS